MQIYDSDERILDPYRRVLINSFKMEILRLNRTHPDWEIISYGFDNGPRCDIFFSVENRQLKMIVKIFYSKSIHLSSKTIKCKSYILPRLKFNLHIFGRTRFD